MTSTAPIETVFDAPVYRATNNQFRCPVIDGEVSASSCSDVSTVHETVLEKRNRKSRPAQAVNPPRPTSVLVYLPKRRAHLIHPSLLPNEKQMDGTQDREKQIPSDAGVGTR